MKTKIENLILTKIKKILMAVFMPSSVYPNDKLLIIKSHFLKMEKI